MSSSNLRTPSWTSALLVVAVVSAPGAADAYDEVHAYGVAQFGGAGQCSGPSSHAVHTATAAGFIATFNSLSAAGRWDQLVTFNNTAARGTYFTDLSKNASGLDRQVNSGVDTADVIYIHTHGGHTSSAPYRSHVVLGSADSICRPRTDDHMLFGNGSGELHTAVIKACQSGDYDVWRNGGYRAQFNTASSNFTVWNAFHGNSSCGQHVTAYVTDYAASTEHNGVGENWIDASYDDDPGANTDDCPVSITMGSSRSLRAHVFERGGWRDRENTGAKTGSTYFFMGGCDPAAGVALPQ